MKPLFQRSLIISALCFSPSLWAVDTSTVLAKIQQKLPESQQVKSLQKSASELRNSQTGWFSEAPTLRVEHENDALTGSENIQNWKLGIEAPLWKAKQKKGVQQLEKSYQQQSQALQKGLNLKASDTLRQLLAQIFKAQVGIQSAQLQLLQTQQTAEMIRLRVQTGASPQLDQLLSEKAVLEAKQSLITAKTQYNAALATYQQWSGQTELPTNYQEPNPLQTRSDQWLSQHPSLLELKAKIEQAQAKRTLTLAEKKNPIALSASTIYESAKGVPSNTRLALGVAIPLGDNPAAQSSLVEANQSIAELTSQLTQLKTQLRIQKSQAEQALNQAKQQFKLAKQQLELSKRTLAMAKQSYQAGETGIQNLLTSQKQHLNAQQNYQLRQLQIQLATAQYNQALGVTLR